MCLGGWGFASRANKSLEALDCFLGGLNFAFFVVLDSVGVFLCFLFLA